MDSWVALISVILYYFMYICLWALMNISSKEIQIFEMCSWLVCSTLSDSNNMSNFAVSFASMGFVSLYLAGKLQTFSSHRPPHNMGVLAPVVPLLFALAIALSRTCDYHHHWQGKFLLKLSASFRQFYSAENRGNIILFSIGCSFLFWSPGNLTMTISSSELARNTFPLGKNVQTHGLHDYELQKNLGKNPSAKVAWSSKCIWILHNRRSIFYFYGAWREERPILFLILVKLALYIT